MNHNIGGIISTRERVIAWWNKLGNKQKDRLQREHGINRNYFTLTGREIEGIWGKEVFQHE